ncbi:MAG TPA: lysine--tRNA ligase [Pyrinomonadaceae bacterium]|nr:lysine--tRNA ligase [Pyrinomonadaceae bacterium]
MSTTLPEEIVPDNDQTRARAAHLEEIRELVGNAYPNKFSRTSLTENAEGEDTITSVVSEFEKYVPELKEGERPTPEQLEAANAELGKSVVRVSGRLATPPRVMGKAAFVHLSDGKSRLQIYVRRQEAQAVSNDSGQPVEEGESGWKLFQLLDHGDFVGVEGQLFVTKTGELSVHVRTIQFLSKALVPMPDKMHGISDPEVRQRRRYADLIASSLKVGAGDESEGEGHELSTREVFERRSKLITAMRRYLDDHGYVEVETPMLSPIASGAAARPFVTHHNALDIDLYLRIAPELYLKRLVVGGFERVYELNRNFRNEGISTRHNPEFTMLEFYTAYKDVNWMMDFCEEMIRTTVKEVNGAESLTYARFYAEHSEGDAKPFFDLKTKRTVEEEIDFSEFRRYSMKEAISKYIGGGLRDLDIKDILIEGEPFNVMWLDDAQRVRVLTKFFKGEYRNKALRKTTDFDSWDDSDVVESEEWLLAVQDLRTQPSKATEEETANDIVFLFEHLVEGHLFQPTFIFDFPKVVSPLSKASPDDPTIAERFELYVAGMEVANGFSELNDPVEQLERFEDQARQRERGDEEAMQMDLDYVRALSYGMPPAAGIGIGIDRLTMLLTNRRSIRDVILFPHMRPARQVSDELPPESDEEKTASDS